MDYKLELVPIPVLDVDRAKAFYTEKVGFNADLDHRGQRRVSRRAAHAPGVGPLDRGRDRDRGH